MNGNSQREAPSKTAEARVVTESRRKRGSIDYYTYKLATLVDKLEAFEATRKVIEK
jgi:hypothetical protein